MLYVIYDSLTDINDTVTTSLTSAIMRAGELQDWTLDVSPAVNQIYFVNEFDMDEAEYNDSFVTDSDAVATYTLKQFIDQYGVPELSPMEKENLQHLSAEEQLEVVKWIPDQMLIDELSRRVSEYRTYADAIREASDKLRIYV